MAAELSAQAPLTFRAGELPEGGQRHDGMRDGVYWVQHAGDVVGTAGLDAADGVCLLLAEPEGNHSTRGAWESRNCPSPNDPGSMRSCRWPGGGPGTPDLDPETAPPERSGGLHSPAAWRGCRRALPANWTGVYTPMSICPGDGQVKLCCWPNRTGWAAVSATADSRARQVCVEALLGVRHQRRRSKHGRRGTASPEPPGRWVTGLGYELQA